MFETKTQCRWIFYFPQSQFFNEAENQSFLLGFMLQNTTFIKITISKTTAIPTQKPMSIPKKDVVPNKFIQIVAQFIENTSNL